MLRPELHPPERDARCEKVVERAFRALEERHAPDAELRELEAVVGRRIGVEELHEWFESMSPAEVADQLTVPGDPRVDDLTRAELTEIVRRLMPADELYDPNHEAYWTALFEANVPRPGAAALVYHPPDDDADARGWDPTPEQVVELALSYRAIEL